MYTKKNGRMTFKSNRRPHFKRNNNFVSKGRNKGNVSQQYNKYLKLAKDTSSSGDRIQAEYYYQFTDHYYRLMLELGINLEENEIQEDKSSDQVSLAKRNNCYVERNIARTCRGILGGNGIIEDYSPIRHMANIETVFTYEGTHEMHTLILGQAITGIAAFD